MNTNIGTTNTGTTNTSTPNHKPARKPVMIGALLASGLLTAGIVGAPVAMAANQSPTPTGRIVAQDASQSLEAVPSAPRAITVTTSPGATVTITSKNSKPIVSKADSTGRATFTKLTAGEKYTVLSGAQATTVIPVIEVGAAAGLTATTTNESTTNESTTIELSWQHRATAARGGASVRYRVTATPIDPRTKEPLAEATVLTRDVATTTTRLSGIDPQAIYQFRVTPINALGAGQSSIATMSEPLAGAAEINSPAATAPVAKPAQQKTTPSNSANNSSPAPAPGPSTRTIWVCPDTFTEAGDSCRKTAAYTFTTRDYTFHDETQTSAYTFHTVTTGPAPIISEFGTDSVCPGGYNLEDYGPQGKICRMYGAAPTAQVKDAAPSGWSDNGSAYVRTVSVKDATPAGFTDNGSQWIGKDAAPAGWSDDGTQYVSTTSKVARTVSA